MDKLRGKEGDEKSNEGNHPMTDCLCPKLQNRKQQIKTLINASRPRRGRNEFIGKWSPSDHKSLDQRDSCLVWALPVATTAAGLRKSIKIPHMSLRRQDNPSQRLEKNSSVVDKECIKNPFLNYTGRPISIPWLVTGVIESLVFVSNHCLPSLVDSRNCYLVQVQANTWEPNYLN